MGKVVYLMSGPAHLPYLVVSLCSLRAHWQGGVTVYAYPESFNTAKRICEDDFIQAECVLWDPEYRGKNGQFLNKIRVMRSIGSDCANMYLDADTMVNGDISPVISAADSVGFAATQFNDWTTQSRTIQNRVRSLVGNKAVNQIAVQYTLSNNMPSLNGGVFACHPKSSALHLWWDWTSNALDIFIADETVLHVVSSAMSRSEFTVVPGGAYNCSPKYMPSGMKDSDVRIWHFHGDSNVRPSKSKRGFDMWWPRYEQCLDSNIGGMGEWALTVGNKYIDSITAEKKAK